MVHTGDGAKGQTATEHFDGVCLNHGQRQLRQFGCCWLAIRWWRLGSQLLHTIHHPHLSVSSLTTAAYANWNNSQLPTTSNLPLTSAVPKNKIQNSTILSIFKLRKLWNAYLEGNLIWKTWWKLTSLMSCHLHAEHSQSVPLFSSKVCYNNASSVKEQTWKTWISSISKTV